MSAANAFALLKLIQAFIFLELIALQVFCKQQVSLVVFAGFFVEVFYGVLGFVFVFR